MEFDKARVDEVILALFSVSPAPTINAVSGRGKAWLGKRWIDYTRKPTSANPRGKSPSVVLSEAGAKL